MNKYPPIAHIVNICFILSLFAIPRLVGLYLTSFSHDFIMGMVLLCWLLGALTLADWYGYHMTNSYANILTCILIGSCVAILSLAVEHIYTGKSIYELFTFQDDAWIHNNTLLKFYVVGWGVSFVALVSLPRLYIIRFFTLEELPETDEVT